MDWQGRNAASQLTKQPSNQKAKGVVLQRVQDEVVLLCLTTPAYTKCIPGFGEQCLTNFNWGCTYAVGIFVLGEGLNLFRVRAISMFSVKTVLT
jgi:hypothetical protein